MKLLGFILPCLLVSEAYGRALTSSDGGDSGVGGGGGRKKRDIDKPLITKQVSTNCRTVIALNINSPVVCSKMSLGNLLKFNAAFSPMWAHKTNKEGTEQIGLTEAGTDPNWYGGPDVTETEDETNEYSGTTSVYLEKLPGKCRYDPYRAMIDPNTACLCVATQESCTKDRQGCYWHEDSETGYRECISKAERFYNQLYALLSKRGKKSFAINIRYGATPARGNLPYGPWGPAVIGYGNPSPSQQVGLFRKSYGGGYKRPHRPQPPPPYGYQQSLGQDSQSPASYQQGHAADPNFKGDTEADEAASTGGRQEHSAGPAGPVSMNDLLGAAGTLAASTGSMGMYGESVGGYGNMGGMTTGMNGAMGGSSGGMTGGYGSMGSGTGATGGMTGGYGSMGEMTGAMGGMSGGYGSMGGMSGAMGGMSGGYGSMGGMSGAMGGMSGAMGGMSGGYGSMGGMSGAMGGMSGAMGGMSRATGGYGSMGGMTGATGGYGGGMGGDSSMSGGMVGDMAGMGGGMGGAPYMGKKKKRSSEKKKRSTDKRKKRSSRKKREEK